MKPAQGYNLAMQFCMHTLVGAGLGYGLDHWLGTVPLFLIGGLFFGFFAGLRYMLKALERDKTTPITTKMQPWEDDAED